MKIRRQILATLGLVTLLPTVALGVLSYRRTATEIEQRVDRSMHSIVERTAAHLDGQLTGLLEDVRSIATLPALRTTLDSTVSPDPQMASVASDLLHSLLDRDPVNGVACGLLDTSGRVVADPNSTCVARSEASMPYFAPLMAGGMPWAGIARWDDGAFPVLVVASSVRSPGGRVVGVLRLVLDTACLQQLLGRSEVSEDNATLLLLDHSGRVIADASSPERRFGNSRLTVSDSSDEFRVDWFSSGSAQRTHGHAVATKLTGLPWRLVAWQTDASYTAPINHLLRGVLLQSCAAVAFLLLAAAVASKLVAAPIQRLGRAAQAIADGNLETPIPIGMGEVGSLGRILEHMRDHLLMTMARLQEAAADAMTASQVKSQFLANMSHELRTPMTAIIGYTEMLTEADDLSPESRNQANTILRNARHLLELVNEVLDLAKVEAGAMELSPVDFSPLELLQNVAELLRVQALAKQIGLTVEVEQLPPRIRADQYRIRQILVNLVGNAVKFTDRGGVVIRAAAVPMADGSMMLSCSIADTGSGIDTERLADLFQPFAQVDSSMSRRHGGTGLGLALSRKIANLLGGDIAVESSPEIGSTFTLTVPFEVCDPSNIGVPEKEERVRSLRGRILLVEDGQDNQKLFAHILRNAGASVIVANNGLEAVDALCHSESGQTLLQLPPPCDLVLMDMQMPVLDGYSATRRLRELGLHIPVIALTAHAMDDARQECLDAGCNECATKPISGKKLLALCSEWLARSAGHAEAAAPTSSRADA